MKVLKKFLASASAIMVFLNICSLDSRPLIGNINTVSAESSNEEMTYDPFKYKIFQDSFIKIIDCEESVTEVDIPSEIDGLPVLFIEEYAFKGCASLKSITIPDGINHVKNGAFWDCLSLTSITISDSVISFSRDACIGCNNLIDINVSENNEAFSSENGVLFNKDKTQLIKYPEGKEEKDYIIPNGVVEIYSSAFAECSALTSVTIPDGVESIGAYSFALCPSLTSVTIPDSVIDIARYSFCICSSLKEITIKGSDTLIEEEVGFGSGTISNGEGYYNGIIRAYKNSEAQKYAEEKGYKFKVLYDKKGDVTGNGTVDLYDAIEIAKSLIGKTKFTDEEKKIADFNGDNTINVYDAIDIAKALLKKDAKNS